MQVVYLLNENPIFYAMFSVSVRLLRKYNPNISVKLLYIQDNGKDSWRGTNKLQESITQENAKKYLITNKEQLFDLCNKLNIEVEFFPEISTQNYSSLHRCYLKGTSCLLMDVDTFIFKEIDFKEYEYFDFTAHPMMSYSENGMKLTRWVVTYLKNGLKKISMYPFNSGVIFWNNDWMSKYGEEVIDYCNKLKYKKHPMSDYMYTLREDGRSREEVACTLFVLENDLQFSYFDRKHVQTFNFDGDTTIFHSTSAVWGYYFNFFVKKKFLVCN